MNRPFIIITIIATILLIGLIIITSMLKLGTSPADLTSQTIAPTSTPNNINSSIAPTLTQQENQKRLSDVNKIFNRSYTEEQLRAIDELQEKLASGSAITGDFGIGYSEFLNEFFVKKYTKDADDKLEEFFDNEVLTELYKNNAAYGLFRNVGNSSVDEYIGLREAELEKARGERLTTLNDPATSDEATKKQLESFNILFDLVLDPGFDEQPQRQTSSSGELVTNIDGTLYGPGALDAIINEAAQRVGVPAKIIKAIMRVECPLTLKLSDADVNRFSQPGNGVPFCAGKPPHYDSGPMQFIRTTWPYYANSVNTYGGYSHKSNVMNIRDSVYAGAVAIKKHSKTTTSSNWSYQTVLRTITCYNAGCGKYPDRISAKVLRYFNRVWNEYNAT